MIRLAQSEESVAVSPDDLDVNPFLLNVSNGTIDLQAGILKPHSRDDLITKLAPVEYDPQAKMPLIESWLQEIMSGSQELIDFIKRMLGYSLTGDIREHMLPICYGIGANWQKHAHRLISRDARRLRDFDQHKYADGQAGRNDPQ